MHLVRTGHVEPEWARELGGSLDDRLMADYSVHVRFSREETIENGIGEEELEVEPNRG